MSCRSLRSCFAVTGLLVASWNVAAAEDHPPQAELKLFAGGEVTTVNGLALTADGQRLFVSLAVGERDSRGRERVRIFQRDRLEEGWGPPAPVSFSERYTDYQPVLAPGGGELFFTSTRPLPGRSEETRQNVWWVAKRHDGSWGEPRLAEALASPGWDGYAVPTLSGNLYFVSDRPGGRGSTDLWVSRRQKGSFSAPVPVAALNSEHGDSDIWVDPRERWILFHRYVEATKEIDLWIAYRTRRGWSRPKPWRSVNGRGWELSPTVSPDGICFFFQRDDKILTGALARWLPPKLRRRLDLDPGDAGLCSG